MTTVITASTITRAGALQCEQVRDFTYFTYACPEAEHVPLREEPHLEFGR